MTRSQGVSRREIRPRDSLFLRDPDEAQLQLKLSQHSRSLLSCRIDPRCSCRRSSEPGIGRYAETALEPRPGDQRGGPPHSRERRGSARGAARPRGDRDEPKSFGGHGFGEGTAPAAQNSRRERRAARLKQSPPRDTITRRLRSSRHRRTPRESDRDSSWGTWTRTATSAGPGESASRRSRHVGRGDRGVQIALRHGQNMDHRVGASNIGEACRCSARLPGATRPRHALSS